MKKRLLQCFIFFHLSLSTSLAWAEDFSEAYVPTELEMWLPSFARIVAHLNEVDPTLSQLQEALNAKVTQEQRLLPTLSADANLVRGQSSSFEGNRENASNPRTTDLQLNLTLRQNIYNGGADWKKISLAESRVKLTQLRRVLLVRNHLRNWLRDTAGIHHQKKIVSYHVDAAGQAKALNLLASRKESSGFLGKRDLLDSQRELLRVEQESIVAANTLEELKGRLRMNYGAEFDDSTTPSFFQKIAKQNPQDQFNNNSRTNEGAPQIPSLLNLAIMRGEYESTVIDEGIAKSSRFTPRLDAIAQAGQTHRMEKVSENASGIVGSNGISGSWDSTRRWSIALAGEISMNPSNAFGQIEESRQKIKTAQLNQEKQVRETRLALETLRLKLKQTRMQKKSAEQLLSMTSQMREKNQRLFEAGELPIDRLIATQQDLNRDRIALAVVEHQELLLAMDLLLSEKWNLPPHAATMTGMP
ncbi:MAG: TolC family protein [Silvanigrellaceae bacterium]